MFAYNSPTDRMMARVAITIFALGALYGLFSLQPVYWRVYATVIKPFEDPSVAALGEDPFEAIIGVDKALHKPPAAIVVSGSTPAQNNPVTNPVASPPPKKAPPPAAPKEVNLDQYTLTKEHVMKYVQDGYIMVTWANEHYIDFARSWVANLKKVGITGYIVGAMDDDMLRALVREDINTWRMNTGITKSDLGWGSPNFHKMGRSKISLIKQFMEFQSFTLVISDIDTAWMRNPIPFFNRFPEADVLTSSDELRPTVKTEDLEKWPQAGSAFNIGIMLFRPKSKQFVDEWIKKLEKPDVWDQNAFNEIIKHGAPASGENGLFKGYNGQLTVGILPVSQFASGHVFFVQRKHEEFGLQPYVAHATFQYSGTPGKRHRFREAMLFEDPPSYYDHHAGFITFKMDIPQELLANATGKHSQGPMTHDKLHSHFKLVHHQLSRVRSAIALAQLTGRVLVLPPIWCELDKYWAPLYDGNIPGSVFRKPFICPMDHILDIEGGWFHHKPADHFGPHVEWREYSFFQNPRMSKAVNESRLTIEICPKGTAGCSDGSTTPAIEGNKIRVQEGLNSDQLKKVLAGAGAYKVLDFQPSGSASMATLWPPFFQDGGWFTDREQHKRFVHRLKHMTTVSCCLSTQPGWIWYDFLWDVPHADRFNRRFDRDWHIKLGDTDKRPTRLLLQQFDEQQQQVMAVGEPEQKGLSRHLRHLSSLSEGEVIRAVAQQQAQELLMEHEQAEMKAAADRYLKSIQLDAMYGLP